MRQVTRIAGFTVLFLLGAACSSGSGASGQGQPADDGDNDSPSAPPATAPGNDAGRPTPPPPAPDASPADPFNQPGNVLIADQFNNRVIEVDPQGKIIWQFGDGASTPGAKSIVGPNDVERVGDKTLIAGTGAPAGSEASCTKDCLDNRVILVDKSGQIVWQYGQAGVAGSGDNELDTPASATYLPSGNVLISDQGNARVIEVDSYHHIVWQYGTTGTAGSGDNQLDSPNSAELLANGHVLIAEQGNNRVVEVSREKKVVWSYGDPADTTKLDAPNFACRLDNGNTLVADGGHSRILEITSAGQIAWQLVTNTRPGSTQNTDPSSAVRLKNGHTLVSDKENDQILEVDQTGTVVRAIGTIGVSGNGPNQLATPYSAREIGDYTGITSPK